MYNHLVGESPPTIDCCFSGDLVLTCCSSAVVLITLPITKIQCYTPKAWILTILWDFEVGDVLLLEEVLGHNLVDLVNCLWYEFIWANVDLSDVRVFLKRLHQGFGIRLLDVVARHIDWLDRLVHIHELSERFAEHVAELICAQANKVETRIIVQQIKAQFRASLIVQSIKAKVQADQWFVDLQGLGEEAGTIVRNTVVIQVQVGKNLGL